MRAARLFPHRVSRENGPWSMWEAAPATSDARTCCITSGRYAAAQGPERDRINRVWIVTMASIPPQTLLAQHPGLRVVRSRDAVFLAQFAGAESGSHVYIVDPLGNLMMRFPANPDPSRMIRDIKHLLNASQIG